MPQNQVWRNNNLYKKTVQKEHSIQHKIHLMVYSSSKIGKIVGDGHGQVHVESVLRLRPLLKKEREENVVLKPQKTPSRNAPATVVLQPPRISVSSPEESDTTMFYTPTEYHFNQVLPETTSQDKIYYSIGLPIATEAMTSLTKRSSKKASKNHLMICMGVCNSGKTHTCFGGSTIPKRRTSQDGMVPRLVDTLFSQSKHHANGDSRSFAVRISMVQVDYCKGGDPEACKIHDLLGSTDRKKSSAKVASPNPKIRSVKSMAARFEKKLPAVASPLLKSAQYPEVNAEDPNPSTKTCHDVTEAREVLQNGLDASRRSGRGGKSSHLLVTLQPMVNNNQYGNKIAILDMAGLEKGKRTQNRVKDRVASSNHAACGAVLHCLRALIYNTNISLGKVTPLDIEDDLTSELSCVSQEKFSERKSLKTVPFSPNKVTMLLSPLFSNSQSTDVTLLMTAYPGHADYAEKKSLLQDMEVVCGKDLLSANARVSTGFEKQDSEPSILSSVLSEVEADYGFKNTSPKVSKGGLSPSPFRLPRESNVSKRISNSEEDKMAARPPAYAPSFVNTPVPKTEKVPLESLSQSHKKRHTPASLSDFPGVNFQTPTISGVPQATRYASSTDKRSQVSRDGLKDPRLPLGRSSLENSEQRQSFGDKKYKSPRYSEFATKTQVETPENREKVIIQQERLRMKQTQHSPLTKVQMDSNNHFKKRIQELEAEVRALNKEKKKTEKKCKELEHENESLKRLQNRSEWSNKDEEEYLQNRKLRLEDQNLVKAPLYAHLKQVDHIYDIKNQWCMTDKPHFSLQFPSFFQRAPDLDIRDRMNEELEASS